MKTQTFDQTIAHLKQFSAIESRYLPFTLLVYNEVFHPSDYCDVVKEEGKELPLSDFLARPEKHLCVRCFEDIEQGEAWRKGKGRISLHQILTEIEIVFLTPSVKNIKELSFTQTLEILKKCPRREWLDMEAYRNQFKNSEGITHIYETLRSHIVKNHKDEFINYLDFKYNENTSLLFSLQKQFAQKAQELDLTEDYNECLRALKNLSSSIATQGDADSFTLLERDEILYPGYSDGLTAELDVLENIFNSLTAIIQVPAGIKVLLEAKDIEIDSALSINTKLSDNELATLNLMYSQFADPSDGSDYSALRKAYKATQALS